MTNRIAIKEIICLKNNLLNILSLSSIPKVNAGTTDPRSTKEVP